MATTARGPSADGSSVRPEPVPWWRQSSRRSEGPGPLTSDQPADRHGGNARFDEEVAVSATPGRKPVLGRPPVGGTEEELRTWARTFVARALGPIGMDSGLLESDASTAAPEPDTG